MPARIRKTHFTGASHLYGAGKDSLSTSLRGIAQNIARMAATAVPALTDNSGGATADGVLNSVAPLTLAALGSSDCVAATVLQSGFATGIDALKELAAKTNAVAAKVPVGLITDSLVGTAADDTIGAVTTTYAGAGASLANGANAKLAFQGMLDRAEVIAYQINRLCVATGVAPLTGATGGAAVISHPGTTLVLAALPVAGALGTATGANSTSNAVIKSADAAAKMTLFAGLVAEMAAKLNAVVGAPTGYLVANTVAV